MFDRLLFNLMACLIVSRWARGYEEHHGACEENCAARLGPLHLEANYCFVLDHDDASVSVRVRGPWGRMHLGYVVCLGQDPVRRPGFFLYQEKPLPRYRPGSPAVAPDEPLPF
jgi:hypothetical protein